MSTLSLTFLGCGDAFGTGGRFQTCFLLEAGNQQCLLDCGASSLVAMKQRDVSPTSVAAILVSHLHGDHFGGIPFFVLDALISKRQDSLTIAGPPGLEARVRDAMEVLFPDSSRTKQSFPLEFIELPSRQPRRLGPLQVTPYPVIHHSGAPAYALRVECDGRTIAYSGDTEWTDALLDAAAGADLFVCEATAFDRKMKFHLDYQTVLAHRDALACKRLVITHMGPDMLARAKELELECADDGLTIVL